ncbi:hypothetical protein Back2_11540 [Nocardioides baekrokdamisoli]|uniref:Uncharacterized protein n=1 Tax=Nocardioides baekrokdamisoli TaxID=1804624 RepID=A0A3G9ID34_9ACTN|nr:hypothetical protein [Nocardioides baekrokdamisoli]BBH16867.1 hypothetical protein Back2_11540 [Nocardioides baekrokdamisoli]
MGNLDFTDNSTFSWYVVLLIGTGIAMCVLAGLAAKPSAKLLNLVFGIGFVGYGVYLGWMFHGGTYLIFFKAFILPVVLIFSTVRGGLRTRREAKGAQYVPAPSPTPVEGAPTPPPAESAEA